MAAIRPIDQIANRWATITPQRQDAFGEGVRQPRRDWAQSTSGQADAWQNGVQRAIQQGSFASGVNRAGTGTWQNRTLEVGVNRWGPGVQVAENRFNQGFAPFREAIARLSLPQRFSRRDSRNLERVRAVVNQMIETAQRRGGTTTASRT